MTFKLLKPTERTPVENVSVILYGPEGNGKTTLGMMTDPAESILVDFNLSLKRSAIREGDALVAPTWSDTEGFFTREVLSQFKLVVIDTAGFMLDRLTNEIIAKNKDLALSTGGLTQAGYGVLRTRFLRIMDTIKDAGCNLVLLAHNDRFTLDEQAYDVIDMTGGSKKLAKRDADQIGRIIYDAKTGRRVIDFRGLLGTDGKDTLGLGVIPISDAHERPTYLSDLVYNIKERLDEKANREHAAQMQSRESSDILEPKKA